MNKNTPIEEREQHFIDELSKKLPTLKYIGGYKHSESKVLLQCKKCGKVLSRCASIIRFPHYIKFRCNYCDDIERQISKLQNDYIKTLNKKDREMFKWLKEHTIKIKQCELCGNDISGTKNYKFCDKCARSKKTYDKRHSNKSLQQLYKRDKGICYICGNKCDYEDYTYKGNTFIAGNYYPSIDHIIPLCKGGTDEWHNLKLAHRICNSIKSIDERV